MSSDSPQLRTARLGVTLRVCAAGALAGVAASACGAPVVTSPPTAQGSRPAATGAQATPDPEVLGVLQQAWTGYKQVFIQPDGRVIDPKRGGITTSEGQSYALLRAAWMDDGSTFDTVWTWTSTNLQVRDDHLFAALWGNGTVQDRNSASDADSDIALALLFAARRFSAPRYGDAAAKVLAGIWQADVVSVAGMNVLAAGNWATAQQSPGPVVNPSYFAPYAYRTFAAADGGHPWMTLVDSAYTVLERCTSATLGHTVSAGLPPNWCAVRPSDGAVVSVPQMAGGDNYGYDAFRVMWRVAVDALWNGESRARDYLSRHDFLRRRWASEQRLDPVYAHDGAVVSGYDDATVYGGDVGNFLVGDPATAVQVRQKLMASYQPGSPAHFGDPANYYEQNWVWFGLALAGGALPNLDGA